MVLPALAGNDGLEEEWTARLVWIPPNTHEARLQVMENEQPQPWCPWEADYRVRIQRGGV